VTNSLPDEGLQNLNAGWQIIETPRPSVGLVIGTFAAVPYIHLALESWRRNYPDIPVLVSDDGSPNWAELSELCKLYGADFVSYRARRRWTIGDLSSYVHGLDWAQERQLDLLVKMSRRFIPLYNWVPGLQQLAYKTQYPTYSNQCLHFNFGFRTECVGFHLASWMASGVVARVRSRIACNEPIFVEGYLHELAREVYKHSSCGANREYEKACPRPSGADAYGVWEVMADQRTTRKDDVLWHDCNEPCDYYRAAVRYGLPYMPEEFSDPNQGYGLGEP
jgi:hypothetical protein